MKTKINVSLILMCIVFIGCQTTPTNKPEDTSLYKTWSNVYLVEMGNSIAHSDFESYVFYMSEYETELKRESKRRILIEGEDTTRYGDPDHEYYVQTTMKMAEGDSASAYFYLTRYMDIMRNRFLYNMDWKPIPDYAK
tara:strand:- start:4021 stop:4434 length:414 start_codon:yes stop_codon:yes gene_type:complete